MSYALVMWGEAGADRPSHKIEDLEESKGFIRIPAADGEFRVVVVGLSDEGARAYRKAENNGEDPVEAVDKHKAAEKAARDEAAAKEAESAKSIGNAVQGERQPAPAAPEPRDPPADPSDQKLSGTGENPGGDGQV